MDQRAVGVIEAKPVGTPLSGVEWRFDRSLVQMATGAGETYTVVTEAYGLLKHGGFARILFLVDRNNLARITDSDSHGRHPG